MGNKIMQLVAQQCCIACCRLMLCILPLHAQQIFMLQKVEVTATFCNMKICCAHRWQYMQHQTVTCNATLLRNNMQDLVVHMSSL